VEEVVEQGQALSSAVALAEKVANQSPTSVTACKELIQNCRSNSIVHGLVNERELFIRLFDSYDQKEGVNAFLEKRAPHWKNS
jgi:enoyl-CoA hydratase/carnithine racemase